MDFADGSKLPVDVVVFATGVRPARRARPGRRPAASASAAASSSTRPARTDGPGRLRDRRGRLHRGPHLGPGRARLHDGRDRRRPAARRLGDLPRRRHLDQAEAPRRRRRQLRRRVRAIARRARGRVRRPGGRRLQEARDVRRRADPARRRPRRRRQRLRLAAPDGRPGAAAPTRPRCCCPRAAAPAPDSTCPTTAHVCSCNNVTAGHDPRAPSRDEGCTDLGRGEGVHARPAPRAAPACRW